MKVTASARPFVLTFLATGTSYPLTSDEAQRLLDEQPIYTASRHRVVFHGHNTARASERTVLRPATLGGGPAFTVERADITPAEERGYQARLGVAAYRADQFKAQTRSRKPR